MSQGDLLTGVTPPYRGLGLIATPVSNQENTPTDMPTAQPDGGTSSAEVVSSLELEIKASQPRLCIPSVYRCLRFLYLYAELGVSVEIRKPEGAPEGEEETRRPPWTRG